jgi:hypothetical protein
MTFTAIPGLNPQSYDPGMHHIVLFAREAWIRFFIQRDYEADPEEWLEQRREMVEAFGTVNPEPYFDTRLGQRIVPTPPEDPPMPAEGPALDSRDCLRLVHRYSESEWEAVLRLHEEVRERVQEEDRQRKEAEAAAKPPTLPPGHRTWSRPVCPSTDATKGTAKDDIAIIDSNPLGWRGLHTALVGATRAIHSVCRRLASRLESCG